MAIWYPDFCPDEPGCVFELNKVGGSVVWLLPKSVIRLCSHHQNIKNTFTLTNNQIFRVCLFSSRRKERARWEAKLELALDKEETIPFFSRQDFLRYVEKNGSPPPAPFCRGEAGGGFSIVSGLTGGAKTALQTRISNALSGLETESGISVVAVE